MKIRTVRAALLVLAALLLFFSAAEAQQSAEGKILTVLSENDLQNPEQLQLCGSTAACFAQKDGRYELCLFEEQDDGWKLVVCNEKALRNEKELPTMVLDADNALFWTYLYPDKVVRFHAARGNDGIWGCVDETASFAMGDVWHTYSVSWSSDNSGEILRSAVIEDENGNNLTQDQTTQYLPAPWLSSYIGLGSFDLSRFPSMGFSGDDSDAWPGQTFLSEVAAAMMPEYTYVKGLLQSGHLHFLMEKPDGSRVYTVCCYGENLPRTIQLQESSALPKETYLGVENFSDSLGIEKDGQLQAVSVQTFPRNGGSGIGTVWNFSFENPLVFGKNCFYSGIDQNTIWYGNHPWRDLCVMDWDSIPASVEEAKNGFHSEEFAVVNNPNPQDRLHLREQPDKGSKSLGKYYNGTPVHVSEIRGDWACVCIGDQVGWMMKKYLTFGETDRPLLCGTSAMPQLMAKTEYELKVYPWPEEAYDASSILYINVFSDSAYHTMKIIGVIGDKWYHVWFPVNEEYGFVKQRDLWSGNG